MNWTALSPAVVAFGAAAVAVGLLLLHLLRVRLRRVEVDTLLFFRLAGAVQKPRVLPGRPARWLAFALALLAALAAWLASGQPQLGRGAPSRFAVLEPDAGALPARLAAARDLLAAGLGPRGAVYAAALPPLLLWRAGEPAELLDRRAAALPPATADLGRTAALAAVATQREPTDDVVWIGAAPPAAAGAHALPAGAAPAWTWTALHCERLGDGRVRLALQARGGELRGEVRAGAAVLAELDAAGTAEFAVLPGTTEVQVALAGSQPFAVPLPAVRPAAVGCAGDVPADWRAAVEAVVAADGELTLAAAAAAAEVVVALADDPADPRPRLLLQPGVGSGPRLAVPGPALPVPLSLRDQRRRAAGALPELADAAVWVEDAAQGGALVAATAAAGRLRLHVVDWLLQPASHADVPLLFGAALRALAARPHTAFAFAGQPVAVPAGFAAPWRAAAAAVAPAAGAARFAPAGPGAVPLDGPGGLRTLHVLAPAAGGGDLAAAVPPPADRGGAGWLAPWLLAAALVLLLLDAVGFHRSRLP